MDGKAHAARLTSQQVAEQINDAVDGVMSNLTDSNAKILLGPALSPLIGHGSLKSIATFAIYTDVLRVVRDITIIDGGISDQELQESFGLLSVSAAYFGKVRKDAYAEYAALSMENARSFLTQYGADTGLFGYRNDTTRWAGRQLCCNVAVTCKDSQPHDRLCVILLELARATATSDGTSRAEQLLLVSLSNVLNVPRSPRVDPEAAAVRAPPATVAPNADEPGGHEPPQKARESCNGIPQAAASEGDRRRESNGTELGLNRNLKTPSEDNNYRSEKRHSKKSNTERGSVVSRLMRSLGAGIALLLLIGSGWWLRTHFSQSLVAGVAGNAPGQVAMSQSTGKPFDVRVVTVTESRIEDSGWVDRKKLREKVRLLERRAFPTWESVEEFDIAEKQIRITDRKQVECFEEAFESPKDESTFGQLLPIIRDIGDVLDRLAIHVAFLSTNDSELLEHLGSEGMSDDFARNRFRIYFEELERYAIAYQDFPDADKSVLHRYTDQALRRFQEGVAAAVASRSDMVKFKDTLDRGIKYLMAMSSQRELGMAGLDLSLPLIQDCKLPCLINSVGMEFRLIPAGKFKMGAENGDEDQRPLHDVTISRPFYLGARRITENEYIKVTGIRENGSDAAMTFMYDDVVKFCEKLSALPEERARGRRYRLATEAEWEYACRAGTTTAFSFGDDSRYLVLYAAAFPLEDFPKKRPNAWGIYEMHGGMGFVPEWVADWYGPYPRKPVVEPTGVTFGTAKVLRGAYESARRKSLDLEQSRNGIGLVVNARVVCELPTVADTGALAVTNLVQDGKLMDAELAFSDAVSGRASRIMLRSAACELAEGWLKRAHDLAKDGLESKECIAACMASQAACLTACKYGASERACDSVFAEGLFLHAAALRASGDITTAEARILDGLARDPSVLPRLVVTRMGGAQGASDTKAMRQHDANAKADEYGLGIGGYQVEAADSSRGSPTSQAGPVVRIEPWNQMYARKTGSIPDSVNAKDFRTMAIEVWRRELDKRIKSDDMEAAFAFIGDAEWLDASTILELPPLRNSVGIQLKLLPTGSYEMGDAFGGSNERVRAQTITAPFLIGVHEITEAEWQAVTGQQKRAAGSDRPVQGISWKQANGFCTALSALPSEVKHAHVYRLPTEAEWEYACRAGTTTRWSFGDDETQFSDYGWLNSEEGDTVHPVGRKKPNAWGLYDMHGNVAEWVRDVESGLSEAGVGRCRGGHAFSSDVGKCRSACRGERSDEVSSNAGHGIRVAMNPCRVFGPTLIPLRQRLMSKITIDCGKYTIAQALQAVSDEIGVPIVTPLALMQRYRWVKRGNMHTKTVCDLRDELVLKEMIKERPAAEALEAILALVGDDGEGDLKYVLRSRSGEEMICIE